VNFIVDAQLPKALSDFLNEKGLNSIHTLEFPERNKTKDSQISKIANKENRILISKDMDFLESFMIKKEPRKLIIVRTGNITNKHLIKIFEENLETILKMIARSNLLEISRSEIAEHE
jgi:predicted nuclease of predicted toxin-antitoxin system